jgi:uncharacterized membrane protein
MTPEELLRRRLKKAARFLIPVFIGFCISIAMFALLNNRAERSVVYYVAGELTGVALTAIAAELKTRGED